MNYFERLEQRWKLYWKNKKKKTQKERVDFEETKKRIYGILLRIKLKRGYDLCVLQETYF